MLRGLRIGVLQAAEARSALADPLVPQQGPVILRVARGAQVGVGDAGLIDGACEVGRDVPLLVPSRPQPAACCLGLAEQVVE